MRARCKENEVRMLTSRTKENVPGWGEIVGMYVSECLIRFPFCPSTRRHSKAQDAEYWMQAMWLDAQRLFGPDNKSG